MTQITPICQGPGPKGETPLIEVLHRAVAVLDVLRSADEGLSIRQVAQRAQLSKSTVQRLLRELVELDLAAQEPRTGGYRLGPRTLALGSAYQRRLDVRQVALPHMTALRDATGETVGLSVPYENQVLHIDQVESRLELRATFDIGRPLPLWSGAPSRLLLAERTDADVELLVRDHSGAEFRPINPPPPDTLIADVRRAREDGHAIAMEETLPGVSTISAPIRGSTGALHATVSLTAPASRLTSDRLPALRDRVLDTARAISAELGWMPRRNVATAG